MPFRKTLPLALGLLSAIAAMGGAILGWFRLADGAAAQVTIDTGIGQTFGLGTADLQQTIINVVQWALGMLALVGVVMIIYGGIVWMTSAGNEQRIEKAKRIIRDAIIGTVIVLLAWAIVIFFMRGISGATGPGGGGGPATCGAPGVCSATACGFSCDGTNWVADAACTASPPCSASDFRVIWRSPAANAVNVPQCRIIQARFSEDVDAATVDNTTFILRDQPTMTTVSGTYNVAGAIVSFRPDADLAQNTVYEVEVTTGLRAVSALSANPETWIFTTGALTDTDPPTVSNVAPPVNGTDVCRQAKVQTVFSEEMDVTTIYGDRTCTLALNCPGPGNCTCTDPVTQRTCDVPAGNQTCTIVGTVRLRNNASGLDLGLKNNFSFPSALSFSAKQSLPPLDASTLHRVVESGRDDPAFYYAGIRDACGNALDGDADGTGENGDGDFGTADDDYEWSFTTGDVEQCIPAITNVNFGNGWYSDDPASPPAGEQNDTRVTITGENLGIVGNVIFNRNVYDIGTCFNPADHRVGQDCPLSWFDTQIVARVPTDSYSSVPGGNPIIVDAGGDIAVAPTPFDVQSPRISVLDPNNGNTNDLITIAGLHLGAGPGTVWFRTPGNQLAGILPAACGPSTWTDTQVIVQIPDLTTIGVAYNTWLTVQVQRADGEWSDAQAFKYVDGPPRPGVCGQDTCALAGAAIRLVGQNFDNGPPVPPSVNHTVAIGATSPASYASWNNTQIDLSTVSTLPNGTHTIKVHTPAGWSNAWNFNVPCGAAPTVFETAQCGGAAGPQPSPYPQKSRPDACRNTGIRLEYNTDPVSEPAAMDNGSITNPANYTFHKCNAGGSFDGAACAVVVPITGVPLIPLGDPSLNAPNHEGVRLNYAGLLDADTWYRITVSNQVRAQSGARMTNDYVWAFRTKAGDACPVTDIWMNGPVGGPPDYLTEPPDSEDYDAQVGNAATCDVFNPWLYTYTWDLVYNTGAVTLSNLLNPWEQRANSAAPGSDRIRVTSEGRSANRRIIVDYCTTDLDCQDYNDDGDTADAGIDCSASLCDDTTKKCTPAFKNAAPAFTPASGTVDNWVTVQGCWFGGGPGSVTFMAGPQNATFPDAALCGDTWQDDEIVAVVPAVGLNGPIRVTRTDGVAATTGASWAEDGIVRPGMCRLVPDSGTYLSSTTAWGHLFGDPRPAGSDLIFTPNAPAAAVSQWIDTRVTGTVPTNAVTGNTVVNNGTQPSNPRLYTVVPAARPTVTATVPADGATGICTNAQIKVTFSMTMKPDSIVNPADATDHPNVVLQ
ncbi:MAG: Ig-like domain-containing protein, partial [Candidatus Kerfeldbacteria bacterium]|nr:Ig-like domain-containing protein [Candidatus Kerfeldbacteria bacterium]